MLSAMDTLLEGLHAFIVFSCFVYMSGGTILGEGSLWLPTRVTLQELVKAIIRDSPCRSFKSSVLLLHGKAS